MPPRDQRLVAALTLPLLFRYGYVGRGRAGREPVGASGERRCEQAGHAAYNGWQAAAAVGCGRERGSDVTRASDRTGGLPNLLVVGVPKAGTGIAVRLPLPAPGHLSRRREGDRLLQPLQPAPPPRTGAAGGDLPAPLHRLDATSGTPSRRRPTYSYGGRPVIEGDARDPRATDDRAHPAQPGRPAVVGLHVPARAGQRWSGSRSFEDYLAACRQRRRDGTDLVPRDHLHGLYIGYYADYVPLWLDAFGDDIRVLFTEHLTRDPVGVIGGVFGWLGIDEQWRPRWTSPPATARTTRAASGRPAGLLGQALDRGSRPDPHRGPGPTAPGSTSGPTPAGPPEAMTPQVRHDVEALYRESNEQTAAALRRPRLRRTCRPGWTRVPAAGRLTPGTSQRTYLPSTGIRRSSGKVSASCNASGSRRGRRQTPARRPARSGRCPG